MIRSILLSSLHPSPRAAAGRPPSFSRAWILWCVFAPLLPGCGSQLETRESYLIVPGQRVGAITPETTEAQLRAHYGADRIHPLEVHVGEGFIEEGVEVFPGDPARRLQIVWSDRGTPRSVHVLGSAWHTPEGVELGSTLRELERLNEGSFQLTGFSWDYSGTVVSWNGGKLENELGRDKGVILRLAPEDGSGDPRVDGDAIFPSDHPVMQELNPVVYAFVLDFE